MKKILDFRILLRTTSENSSRWRRYEHIKKFTCKYDTNVAKIFIQNEKIHESFVDSQEKKTKIRCFTIIFIV
ncbi:hypothetical protein Y032_0032g2504 [Ancylostoma ceylanicum]|uniref:Uncharacterized protein n=1 Tax=Ancylostoma ceylanicum TaxID=53326 RepID=A0A016UPE7_9BILA|nr:hypothetical protein Y032_0032g2504 [Ancylostoma ceylanicum]